VNGDLNWQQRQLPEQSGVRVKRLPGLRVGEFQQPRTAPEGIAQPLAVGNEARKSPEVRGPQGDFKADQSGTGWRGTRTCRVDRAPHGEATHRMRNYDHFPWAATASGGSGQTVDAGRERRPDQRIVHPVGRGLRLSAVVVEFGYRH
jgi:hypothetical protein